MYHVSVTDIERLTPAQLASCAEPKQPRSQQGKTLRGMGS